jgi:transcriptional regulator with XRE-family HTH domain
METFAQRIRERARELGLSDAEVARRAGLSERRYGYYATGEREPNLATLVRICEVLAATPNDLLLPEGKPPARSGRDRLLARITAAAYSLTPGQLDLAGCLIECVSAHRPMSRGRGRRAGAVTDQGGAAVVARAPICLRCLTFGLARCRVEGGGSPRPATQSGGRDRFAAPTDHLNATQPLVRRSRISNRHCASRRVN